MTMTTAWIKPQQNFSPTDWANKRPGRAMQSSNQPAQPKIVMHHHGYFSAVQKSSIGAFISVSGTHEPLRLEHLSQSTHAHTVHSMELWSARQSLLQTYVPSNWTGSWVCHPSCSLHPNLQSPQSNPGRGRTYKGNDGHTHAYKHSQILTLSCI